METGKDEATYYTYDNADELIQHMKADVYTYFTYDNDGNQTSKKVGDALCYYNYDVDNMLTTFTEGETEAEYVYDASPGIRRRVKAVVDGTVTYYAFDGLNVLADYDGSVSAQRTYVVPFLDDSLVLRTGGNDYHYTLDALGSVANLLDGNEAVQNDYLYEAFGSPHGTPTQNVTNRLRYTGREWDPTPSLYQYRARSYAPALARFATRDPLGPLAEPNLYTYAKNQPTNLLDPTGTGAGTVVIPPLPPVMLPLVVPVPCASLKVVSISVVPGTRKFTYQGLGFWGTGCPLPVIRSFFEQGAINSRIGPYQGMSWSTPCPGGMTCKLIGSKETEFDIPVTETLYTDSGGKTVPQSQASCKITATFTLKVVVEFEWGCCEE